LLATPVIARGDLTQSARPGPLIIQEYDTNIVVPPACSAALDRNGNVVIEVGVSKA